MTKIIFPSEKWSPTKQIPASWKKATFANRLLRDCPKLMFEAGSPTMIVSFTSKCKTKRRIFDIEGGEVSMAGIFPDEWQKKIARYRKKTGCRWVVIFFW